MLLRLRNRFGLSAVIVLALLLAAGSDRAQSSEPRKLRIGTFVIPLMVVDEENGIFIELTNEILKRANLEADIILMPPKRTLLYFSTKDVDVIFPALDVFFATGVKYTKPTEIFYEKEDFVFTRKGEELLRIVPELEEKYVGITRGYAYAPELMENRFIHIERANTDEQNAHKLITGRMDAFVVEEHSGLKAFKNTGLEDKVQYDPNTPLSRQDVFYAFQGSNEGQALAVRFSDALRSMKEDGTFASIMNKAKTEQNIN
ncbi:ABC transporter substrate-binding protein [Labrenzia sp. PHM005]|uniref:substrate-binding periplasmic protein n=1 Tax=Labrenzia sp. PHM005 TaxID=2590016 RepID=UPI0011403295|nr:transporter substrate-binding domain-containing protein [Labrenzia sp. PHM005]QDG77536.1 transporter substrate-binding domain-containing protein [Labrenzia sp. PHM005]